MPWRPLPRIAFAVATFPFQPTEPADLPLELGDELYIIEQGGKDGAWYRGYLVAPPSLLSGLTSRKGQTLEARVFSGIFPANCVEVRELLGGQDSTSEGTRHTTATQNDLDGAKQGKNGITIEKKHGSFGQLKDLAGMDGGLQTLEARVYRASESSSPSSRHTTLQLLATEVAPLRPGEPKPPAPVPMLKIGDETPTSALEPLVDEIASCLREWHSTNLHELLLARQYGTLEKMSGIVTQLDLSRRQLLHDVLTAQERAAVREQTVWNLVKGNKMLGGEIIVRDPKERGRLLTGDDSAIEMTKLQAVMSLLDSNPLSQTEPAALHHLLFEVKAITGAATGSASLSVALYLKSEDGTMSPLSETFAIELPAKESFANLARSSKLKTIFTDLGSADLGEKNTPANHQIYLVIKVQSYDAPKTRPSSRDSNTRSPSSDGIPPLKANGFTTGGKGSMKAGRRSLMFGTKAKGLVNGEQHPGREAARTAPAERAPSSDRLRITTSNNSTEPMVPRTVGVGVLEVGQVLRQDKEVDVLMNVWSPAGYEDDEDELASQMDQTVASLLQSPTRKYVRTSRASRIHLHLAPHAAPDAESLIKKNPTSMHMITRTRKIGFSEAPTQPRSDIYLTLSEAIIPKGGLLSHPETGQVSIPYSMNFQNLQLTMEVRSSAGKRIENSIFPTSNSAGHTAWRTNVAERGSRWDQTICLKVPPEEVPGSHIIMSLANAPGFPFALSWMPLWHENAFLRDGHHTLVMHAYDKSTSSLINGKGAYLSLPWNSTGKLGISKDESVTGPASSLLVETYLCSTRYSQDPVILSLINWKMQTSAQLLDSLKKIVFVPEIEIVKQLRDVFDALFAILVNKNGDKEYEDLVFNDLVTVLGIVHDRRFNLVPLVDNYTETQFNYPFATACLMKSYTRLLNNASDPQAARTLRATFKVGRHILKFIMRARTLQKCKEEGIGVTRVQSTFSADMHSIFSAIENMMKNQAPILIGSKTLVVQHFHTWLPELLAGFGKDEVIKIGVKLIDATEDVKGKLILYKLILILNLAQLDEIFITAEDRQSYATNCLRWLAPYWGSTGQITEQWRDQVRLCCSVVSEVTKQPVDAAFDFLPKIVSSYCTIQSQGVPEKATLSLLFPRSIPFQSRTSTTKQQFDETLLELAALISTISQMPVPQGFTVKDEDASTYILETLEAHRSILSFEAYPPTWLSLHVYHHRSTMKALEHISDLLTKSFLPSPDYADQFDMELWKAFFSTLLLLISSDALALETFAEQKRRAVWKIAGDVRENGANLLRQAWESIGWESSTDERRRYGLRRLGGYQVQYVPGIIPQIMELCLSVHEGLRRVAVEVLQTMIVSEWALSEDLSLIETEMIASLDVIFKSKNITESISQKLFINELLGLFDDIAAMPDDALWIALKELVATIDELMDLLVNVYGAPMTESLHMMRLMEFMKDMQKEDIFIRYVHELAENEDELHNPTEAGLALRSHAEIYEWDSEKILPAMEKPAFTEQSAFDRKESLYFKMIQHFEDGKSWNNALSSYSELAEQYEHVVFDYAKLARTQRAMGRIHEAISKDDRHALRYFRVAYLGLGFPTTLRDKEYIFEGLPSERIVAFTDRLQKQYPAAQIISNLELEDIEGQFIYVSSVSAHRDLAHPVFQRPKVPQPVRDHLLTANPIQFSITSRRHMTGTNIKEQWVEKTIYTTAETFPTILKRSEIVSSETVRLSPIQTAIERVWRKTSDLMLSEKKATASEDQNNGALTDMLSHLLDPHSTTQSCMAPYRELVSEPEKGPSPVNDDGEADISDDEMPAAPRDPLQNALLVALADHAATIKRCLALYKRPSLQATGAELTSRFERLYPQELRLKTPTSAHGQPGNFSVGSSPPRVSMDTNGKIAIDPLDHRSKPSIDRAMSPEVPSTSHTTQQASRDKPSRMSLQFLKGATNSMFSNTDRTSKELTRMDSHSQPSSSAQATQVNGFHGAAIDSSAINFLHESFSASANSTEHPVRVDSRTTSESRERSKSRNRLSMFGGSRHSEDDGGKQSQSLADGLGIGLPINLGPGHSRGVDGPVDDRPTDRPATSGSSSQAITGTGGSQSARAVKKRFSILKLGKKKSEANVRVSEVLEE